MEQLIALIIIMFAIVGVISILNEIKKSIYSFYLKNRINRILDKFTDDELRELLKIHKGE